MPGRRVRPEDPIDLSDVGEIDVDSVAVDRVKEFQTKLEEYLTTRKGELMDQLANEKTLDNVEAGLKSALDDFKASWK